MCESPDCQLSTIVSGVQLGHCNGIETSLFLVDFAQCFKCPVYRTRITRG